MEVRQFLPNQLYRPRNPALRILRSPNTLRQWRYRHRGDHALRWLLDRWPKRWVGRSRRAAGKTVAGSHHVTPGASPAVGPEGPLIKDGVKGLGDLGFKQIAKAIAEIPPEPEWLVDGLIAKGGTCLFVGKPKVGKSTLAQTLCALMVKHGGQFLGRQVTPGPVLYCVAEGPSRIPLDHFDRMLGSDGLESVGLHYHYGRPTDDPLAWAEDAIKAAGATFMVLDPLKAYVTRGRRVTGEYDDAYEELQPFSELASRTGCTIAFCHHAKKSSSDDPGDNILGSTGIYGAVDMALLIANIAGSRTVETPPMRYGIELPKHELILDQNTGMASIGKPMEVRKRDKGGDQVLVLLEDGDPLPVKEIAERCEISEPTMRRALEALEGQGKVVKSDGRPARYQLPGD